MKKVFVLLIMVSLLSGLAFAGGNQQQSQSGLTRVAFIPGDMANESQSFSARMFQRHAADYGLEVVILDGRGDAQAQAQAVTNAIAQGMRAIFINPNDINAIIPSLMQAKSRGIIVGMFSSDVPASQASVRDFFVGVNDNMAGEAAALAFLAQFPSGARIVEIGGQSGHDAQLKRHDGFNSAISGSRLQVLDYKATQQWDTSQAMAIMEDMLVVHGDNIDGIFVHWDNGATGVINALEAAGITGKFIVGVDGNRAGFQQVRDGRQSVTIAQNFETFAIKTLELTQSILSGQPVNPVNFIPLDIVTRRNIDTFTPPEW